MAVDNPKKLFFFPSVEIRKISHRYKVPEITGIFIGKGIHVERLHPGIKSIRKFRLENKVFVSLADIRKGCKEIFRLPEWVIPLEAVYSGTWDDMDIPGCKPVSVIIIIDDCSGIMDLEKRVELVSFKRTGKD
jgi:hypothetical protein